jgi:hypothetical protein
MFHTHKCSTHTNVPHTQMLYTDLYTSLLVSPYHEPILWQIIHPPDRCGISRSWLNSLSITQVHLVPGTIKGHSKMCSFVTQHNATDVSSFEVACNWNADCRNVHQSRCQRM